MQVKLYTIERANNEAFVLRQSWTTWISELSRETKQENISAYCKNNFISATEGKELTYISSSSNVEKFDVFLQDGRHEVPSQVASNAFT